MCFQKLFPNFMIQTLQIHKKYLSYFHYIRNLKFKIKIQEYIKQKLNHLET